MKIEGRLAELSIELPQPPKPMAVYVPWIQTGNLIFLSGAGPMRDGRPVYQGKVGTDLTLEQGQAAARLAALNLLANLKQAIGDLDRVVRIVKVLGFVRSDPEFAQQPEVMNGASELLETVFGDKGRHARSAIGTSALPRNIPVEVEMVVEISG
jgi:enamine deaminase RidA (YjgF/YER057c/UK114 family)